MRTLSRRSFSKLLAASPFATSGVHAANSLAVRRLARIDFKAGMLGLGAQRLGEDRSDQPTTDRVVAEGLEGGINYIDTAPNYGLSEERLGRALKGRRDKIFLVSKIETRTRADALNQVRESLRRLQTDHLDAVLIHNIARDDRFPEIGELLSERGGLGGLLEARKQGMIRHIGCSAHTNLPRVLRAFDTGVFDVIMLPLNFVTLHTYGFEQRLLPEARKRNIAVIAMKVLGGPLKGPGSRLGAPEDYQATLRYVWGLQDVSVAIIGLRTPEELRHALTAARSFKPLNAAEAEALARRGKQLAGQWGPVFGPVS